MKAKGRGLVAYQQKSRNVLRAPPAKRLGQIR